MSEKIPMTATDLAPRRLGGGRILVVERGEESAACLTAMLRLNGFDARSAQTGAEALQLLDEHEPLAVIIDLDLPDMDSCDAIRRMRSRTNPPVSTIVVTAYNDPARRLAARDAGAAAYLLKPARPAELVKLLHEIDPILD